MNCPDTCKSCLSGSAYMVLHHNRLSCKLPENISGVEVHASALMGNMLGDGKILKASWVAPEELQAFLFYSPRVWRMHLQVILWIFVLLLGAALFQRRLRQRLAEALQTSEETAGVISSNIVVMKVSLLMMMISTPLFLLFLLSPAYFSCCPPLSKITVANLKENHISELLVILMWCLLTWLAGSVIASIPQGNLRNRGESSPERDSEGKTTCFFLFFF